MAKHTLPTLKLKMYLKIYLNIILSLSLCLLCLSCQSEKNQEHKTPISESYKFSSEVSSVNLSDSLLYLGLTGNRFIEFNPANSDSKSYSLPSYLNNNPTYYIHPIGADSFLVSKRNYGVTLVGYSLDPKRHRPQLKDDIPLKQQSLNHPFKGQHYSSYSIFPYNKDSLLLGSTNGLMILQKPVMKDTIDLVESLRPYRDGITQYAIMDIYHGEDVENNEVEVFAKKTRWTFKGSLDNPDSIGMVYANQDQQRCFDNWYISKDGSYLTHHNECSTDSFYIGGLGLSRDKGSKVAVLDSTLYYVEGGKLYSIYLPTLGILKKPMFEPLSFAAWDQNEMYLANPSGLYSFKPGEKPQYMHPIEPLNQINGGVVYKGKIYIIDRHSLYRITPKELYNPFPLKPELIKNIIGNSNHNDIQEDELRSLEIANDILYIGTRNTIYYYDLKKDAGASSIYQLDSSTEENNFNNPYFASIAYPYAGSLNDGIYLIDGKKYRNVLPEPADIRKLDYKDNYLACMTNDCVRLYTDSITVGKLTPIKKSMPYFNSLLLDIALSDKELYILTKDSIYHTPFEGNKLETEINPGYTGLAYINKSIVPYGQMSVVDGYVLEPNPVDWWPYVVGFGFLVVVIAYIVKHITSKSTITRLKKDNTDKEIELESRRQNHVYHSTRELVNSLKLSEIYQSFISSEIPDGFQGELHKKMVQELNKLTEASEEENDQIKTAKRNLLELSKEISTRYEELLKLLKNCRTNCTEKLTATGSDKYNKEARIFIYKISFTLNGLNFSEEFTELTAEEKEKIEKELKWSKEDFKKKGSELKINDENNKRLQKQFERVEKKFEEELASMPLMAIKGTGEAANILNAISIIHRLEKAYSEINSDLDVDKVREYATENIINKNKVNQDQFLQLLNVDRAKITILVPEIPSRSKLFDKLNKKGLDPLHYIWDGTLLLSWTNIDPKPIKEYLKDVIYSLKDKKDNDEESNWNKQCNSLNKQFSGLSKEAVIPFLEGCASLDILERKSFIPAKPMDLVLVSSIMYFDRFKS